MYDVNDAGAVVGFVGRQGGPDQAVVREPPAYAPEPLAPPEGDGQTRAVAIDRDGTIIGTHGDEWEDRVGIRWSPGPERRPTSLGRFSPYDIAGGDVPEHLGRIDGGWSVVTAISGDEMVGSATLGPGGHLHPARFAPDDR